MGKPTAASPKDGRHMSRPQTTQNRQEGLSPDTPDAAYVDHSEWLSAAVDGECSETGWSFLSQAGVRHTKAPSEDPDALAQTWMEFHLIGDALRAGSQGIPVPSSSFVSAVMARVAAEQPYSGVQTASTAATLTAPGVPVSGAPAANDAVFRWKMMAGVASLAAVVAVAWQLTVAPAGGLPASLSAPQLAAAPSVVQPAAVAVPRDTVVSTDAGVLLRDPELEAFIAAHRQAGGMSALQMPAGFLRNATFEAPQR